MFGSGLAVSWVLWPVLHQTYSRLSNLILVSSLKTQDRECIKTSLLWGISKAMVLTAEFPIKHYTLFGTSRAMNENVAILDQCPRPTWIMIPITRASFVIATHCRTGTIEIVHTFFNYYSKFILIWFKYTSEIKMGCLVTQPVQPS